MAIAGWKAWYTDNRVYRSNLRKWEDLPKEGVLLVMVYYDDMAPNGKPFRDIIHGSRRYFMATGSSGNLFLKGSLWNENKLLGTYSTKPEWVKEGVWDDDETIKRVVQEALDTYDWR